MSRVRRIALWLLGSVVALALLLAVAGVWIVRSSWFYDQVRQRIVSTLQDATGGRVEIAAFHFDWKSMRAEVRGLVLHGREPADKPPLLRVESAAVGLKVISIFQRDIDL